MNKKQLIEILEPFSDDIEIWVDDNGLGEGGTPLESVEKQFAFLAGLDGDLINNEYTYAWDENENLDVEEMKSKGYTYISKETVFSKEILLIKRL